MFRGFSRQQLWLQLKVYFTNSALQFLVIRCLWHFWTLFCCSRHLWFIKGCLWDHTNSSLRLLWVGGFYVAFSFSKLTLEYLPDYSCHNSNSKLLTGTLSQGCWTLHPPGRGLSSSMKASERSRLACHRPVILFNHH